MDNDVINMKHLTLRSRGPPRRGTTRPSMPLRLPTPWTTMVIMLTKQEARKSQEDPPVSEVNAVGAIFAGHAGQHAQQEEEDKLR